MTDAKQQSGSQERGEAACEQNDKRAPEGGQQSPRQQSRLERLKAKARKLQGKNPDIYPMW